MYLAGPSAACPPTYETADQESSDDLRLRLWRQVRAVFPELGCATLRVEQGGGDHLLLIADEVRVFRFPRAGTHGLKLEIELLRQLARRTLIRMPTYDLTDPDGRFASYHLIKGVPLTAARFAALPPETAQDAVAAAVGLLKRLHGLDPAAVAPAEAWPRMWSAGQFADRLQNDRLSTIARRAPALVPPIKVFLRRYRDDHPPRQAVLHGDLVGDHLLVDDLTGRLAGVIDFSDTALGDPAHDLLGFWAYGASAAEHAVAFYGGAAADPTLLVRSRHHFIRYEIDRLFETIVDGGAAAMIHEHAATLALLLATPFTALDAPRR